MEVIIIQYDIPSDRSEVQGEERNYIQLQDFASHS